MWAGVFWHCGAELVSLRPGASQLPWDSKCKGSSRTVFVNLNRPVAGSGAKPQGVLRATLTKLKLFYRFEGNNKIYCLLDMPVGTSAKSPWTQISIDNMNLMFVPEAVNTCNFRYIADGSTAASLTRQSQSEWVLELPPGSIGHLSLFEGFEQHFEEGIGTGGTTGRQIGGGLYEFSARIRIHSAAASTERR